MPDIRLVSSGQNQSPIIATTIENPAQGWRKPLHIMLVNISGDAYNSGGSSGGDGAILDGAVNTIKATVKSYTRSNPLAIALVNVSGDVYNAATNASILSATYGVKNITTAATLILNRNDSRLAAYVQNVGNQQMFVGFDSSLTVGNAGIVLAPIVNSSGDGGNFSIDKYTGPIYAIMASGSVDARYSET